MIGTRGEVDPAAKLPIIAKRENGAKIIEDRLQTPPKTDENAYVFAWRSS